MRVLELWADEPERAPLRLDPRVISLEPLRRARRDERVQEAYDDGTVTGFFLGVCAAVLAWAILSGLLVRVVVAVVHGALWLVAGRS